MAIKERELRERKNTIHYIPLKGGEYGGHCVICSHKLDPNEMVHICLPNQPRGAWICKSHNNYNIVNAYTWCDFLDVGTPRKDGLQFGCELEVNPNGYNINYEGIAYLIANKFTPTSDCTCGVEWKSPIYYSASSFSKVASAIEELNKKRREDTFDPSRRFTTKSSNVGCHLNISTPFIRSEDGYRYIRNNKKMLFKPLEDYLLTWDVSARKTFFGRDFGGWADTLANTYYDEDVHESWVNTQIKENNRLEFRVCKFMDANQYIKLVRVFSEVCLAINETTRGEDILEAFKVAYSKY